MIVKLALVAVVLCVVVLIGQLVANRRPALRLRCIEEAECRAAARLDALTAATLAAMRQAARDCRPTMRRRL